ncbi:GNAT family N-acetyltransferase [Micrococcus terreus]|nr:GNAT family N-acetyltransferase [Micrococcus terreus]
MQRPPHLTLHPLTVEDAPAMVSVLADPALYEFTGGEPPTEEQLTRRYTAQSQGHSPDGTEQWINMIVVLHPGAQPIGFVQATVPTDGGPAEIAWVIGAPWQGQGHAAEAARQLLAHLAERGVTEVLAHIHPDHTASQRIATHLGLHPTSEVVDGEIAWRGTLP